MQSFVGNCRVHTMLLFYSTAIKVNACMGIFYDSFIHEW